jgi:hypothetical protein
MQTLFAVVYFCTAITCSVGWINEPFQDEITCRAYSQIYAEEMRKREPKSKGEIYCVEESLLKSTMTEFDLPEMKKLDDLPEFKE